MFLLKKVSVLCGICSAVLLLNACANAVFPEIEDEEEITVGEGGRCLLYTSKHRPTWRVMTVCVTATGSTGSIWTICT